MQQVSTARRILEGLAAAGVHTAFGLPGVHNLAFWREVAPGLPRIVPVRHEQTTVYAADGLARATGGLGAALTTTGPGAANAVGAFGEAAASGTPLVLVASEISTALARPGVLRGVLHECRDQAGLFEPLAKAVFRPRTGEQAAEALAEAVRVALTCPRGPVYLDVPTDVLAAPAPPVALTEPSVARPRPADLDRLAAEVAAAGRVVLWAGGGVLQAGATDALDALARRLDAPVVTSYGGRGALPCGHPLLVGLPPHEPEVADLVADADLLLGVGTQFDGMTTRNWSMPRPPRLAAVNVDPGDLTKNYRPDVAVPGDARLALEGLAARLAGLPERAPTGATGRVSAACSAVWARLAADPRTAEAVGLVRALGSVVPAEAVVITDMAVAGYWWGGYGAVARPRALQYPIGWGTLGYALPAAVGAGTRGPVLAISGDGGLMYGLAELATLSQERLPVTVLVVDDGGYGMLRFDQDRAGDPHRGVDLTGPDWSALGSAFGIGTRMVDDLVGDSADGLAAAVAEALASGQPRLLVARASLLPPRSTSPRWHE
ncbi:MAG TPA: thiamine pyrophosphate-binding protein [Mycobacteriales bacterium]|nr:thiamine pyrophosphate-binding protein [Mycobacteriales bacterium]